MRLVMFKYGERPYRLGLLSSDETIIDVNYAYEKILYEKQ